MRTFLTLALVGLFMLAPVAAAQQLGPPAPSSCSNDPDCNTIKGAFTEGFGEWVKSIFAGISHFFGSIFNGFVDIVITPLFQIPGKLFGGLGDGAKELGESALGGAGGSLRASWEELNSKLRWFGPVAPLVAGAIVGAFLYGTVWLVMAIFRRSDDVLPEGIEKIFRDEDDE